jgi:hypothetical protein
MHLRDRAHKHEHQAKAKKNFADAICCPVNWLVHFVNFLSLFWPSLISRH